MWTPLVHADELCIWLLRGPQESPAVSGDTDPFVRVRRTGSTLIERDPGPVRTERRRPIVHPHAVRTTLRTLGEIQYLALVMYADTIVWSPGLRISPQTPVPVAASDRGLLCVMAQARLSGCEQQIMTLDVLCQQMLRHIQALSRSSLQSGVLFSCYLRACFSCLITAVMLSAFTEDWTQRTCFHYEETSICLHILSLASVFLAVQYHIRAGKHWKKTILDEYFCMILQWIYIYIYLKKTKGIYLRTNTE